MKLTLWYKMLLLVWLCIGLPGLVLGYGFGDGFALPDPDYLTLVDIVAWLVAWMIILSPVLLAPFGIRRVRNGAD